MREETSVELPGLDCGLCGYRTCEELSARLADEPDLIRRCIHLTGNQMPGLQTARGSCRPTASSSSECFEGGTTACAACAGVATRPQPELTWRDSLDRQIDFYLEHFPEDPGPREIIIPHNPMLTRELDIQVGDTLIGRPLGMSCGCPITHCGVAIEVDQRTGVIVWCVTGPLGPRQHGYKDLGYYIAEGYEGLVQHSQCEIKIGMRYFFQPRMCMLQWRHSGLVNYVNRLDNAIQLRLEGLWIG